MINFLDIFNSWKSSFNPSPNELKRAQERYDICLGCEFKKKIILNKEWSLVCNACGCPISKKIYSSISDPCPKNKWESVDSKYSNELPPKKTKSSLL